MEVEGNKWEYSHERPLRWYLSKQLNRVGHSGTRGGRGRVEGRAGMRRLGQSILGASEAVGAECDEVPE